VGDESQQQAEAQTGNRSRGKPRSFRATVLRGLTLLLPPILTIVIFLWVASTIQAYILEPVTVAAREVLAWSIADVREAPAGSDPAQNALTIDGHGYTRLASGQWVRVEVVDWLRANLPTEPLPASAEDVYRQYVTARYLQPQMVVPIFVCVFLLLLYVLGKFLAGKIGGLFDWGILRLPLVRKIYAAAKQVTEFVFGESIAEGQPLPYKRVVAIEYPRPGLWSIGLVMGEAVLDVSAAANEPCVTVMLPTSPALFTVKPVMIPHSKTHDVKMTIDQALQFIISCGVVMPADQRIPAGTLTEDSGTRGDSQSEARSK